MKRILIDTDTGSDDAMAIVMALRDERVKVEAITTVAGNVDLCYATKNVLLSIDYAGTYAPPVYEGCSHPIVEKSLIRAPMAHGVNGLADMDFGEPKGKVQKEHAVDALLRILRHSEDQALELVTLGPLTNIAVAIMRAPELVKKLRQITIMGGAFAETGVFTAPIAEFNIKGDVEAANVVCGCGVPLLFAPINACHGEAFMTGEEVEMLLATGTERARFCVQSNTLLIEGNKERFGMRGFDPADPVAMACATAPETIGVKERAFVTFEQEGEITRGMMIFDTKGHYGQEPNAEIVISMDGPAYKKYCYEKIV
ncbi:nucleoside hydrolase [Neobittarella massiliensis]|uniref:nucleoside hydrolase n=1 Tax=Neobittarella massiliensis (ex Bilen et al. 2018) TaxID=2041842 RepID=UPI000CF73DCD|nr:nucleoside hydrolase [Neobittarella massiliensis]